MKEVKRTVMLFKCEYCGIEDDSREFMKEHEEECECNTKHIKDVCIETKVHTEENGKSCSNLCAYYSRGFCLLVLDKDNSPTELDDNHSRLKQCKKAEKK